MTGKRVVSALVFALLALIALMKTETVSVPVSVAQVLGASAPVQIGATDSGNTGRAAGSKGAHLGLVDEIGNLGLLKAAPDADERYAERIRMLNAQQLNEVGAVALDENDHWDDRFAAVYILGKAGREAIPALSKIAAAPFDQKSYPPHTIQRSNQSSEFALRSSALESLDRLAVDGEDVAGSFAGVLEAKTSPQLALMAQLALMGIREGRPGKLTRFIDKAFDEAVAAE